MAFGLSGSMQKSEMLGADVAIAYLDGALGYATDYNITAKAPVSKSGYIFKSVTNYPLSRYFSTFFVPGPTSLSLSKILMPPM